VQRRKAGPPVPLPPGRPRRRLLRAGECSPPCSIRANLIRALALARHAQSNCFLAAADGGTSHSCTSWHRDASNSWTSALGIASKSQSRRLAPAWQPQEDGAQRLIALRRCMRLCASTSAAGTASAASASASAMSAGTATTARSAWRGTQTSQVLPPQGSQQINVDTVSLVLDPLGHSTLRDLLPGCAL
jgi:hypothetical protein